MPWDEWMEMAFAVLKLSPVEFWGMSFREWRNACNGLYKANGSGADDPLTRAELTALIKEHEARKAKGKASAGNRRAYSRI